MWSKELPKESGFYYLQVGTNYTIVWATVEKDKDILYKVFGHDTPYNAEKLAAVISVGQSRNVLAGDLMFLIVLPPGDAFDPTPLKFILLSE